MGGLLILISVAVSVLLWMDLRNPYVWACLLVDRGLRPDRLARRLRQGARRRTTPGCQGKTRLALEFLIAGVATWLIVRTGGTGTSTCRSSRDRCSTSAGSTSLFGAFVIVAFGNAVNLTDGLDGLATMPVIIASIAFLLISYLVGNAKFADYLGIPHVLGVGDLTVLLLAIVGAGLAFLWFNAPPAAVFMGDTGSLALGGALGAVSVATHHEFVLAIVGGLFVVEALSGRHPGRGLQTHRQARLPDGPDPPPFRASRLVRADRRDPLLDHQLRARARGPRDPQAQVITARAFAGKHYAVYGLARSGLATVEALLASGAKVTAWDATSRQDSPGEGGRWPRGLGARRGSAALRAADLPLREDLNIADLDSADLTQFDSLVVTPGLPLNRHPIAQRARDAGVEIIGDIELFARARPELPPHKVVGITGTNGKSTTTALVHHILKTAGVPTTMGGNIGLPILAQDPLPEGGVYVLELSSYQIDLTQSLDCDVAVLLNITPDHLDRYESFEAYAASKARLFEMQSRGHDRVIPDDDERASRSQRSRLGHRGSARMIGRRDRSR